MWKLNDNPERLQFIDHATIDAVIAEAVNRSETC